MIKEILLSGGVKLSLLFPYLCDKVLACFINV